MTTQPLFPVDLYFQPPAKRADGRRPDVAGHIPYHPEVARALRRSLPRNFHANVPMLALFLAACFRWTGKSTKKRDAGDLSFGKTESQWVDELGISKNQIRLAQKLLCVDGTGKSKGAPNLGLVRCIVRAHRNGVENRYTFLSKQAAQWWIAFGPQPALPLLSTDNPQPLLDGGGSADQPAEGSADQPAEGSADQPAEGSADQPAAPYKHTNKQADKPQLHDDDPALSRVRAENAHLLFNFNQADSQSLLHKNFNFWRGLYVLYAQESPPVREMAIRRYLAQNGVEGPNLEKLVVALGARHDGLQLAHHRAVGMYDHLRDLPETAKQQSAEGLLVVRLLGDVKLPPELDTSEFIRREQLELTAAIRRMRPQDHHARR